MLHVFNIEENMSLVGLMYILCFQLISMKRVSFSENEMSL